MGNSKSHAISYNYFGNGYTIISVDCKNSNTQGVLQLEKFGHLNIYMKLAEALVNPINIIIIGYTSGSLEIDNDRRIYTHFNY